MTQQRKERKRQETVKLWSEMKQTNKAQMSDVRGKQKNRKRVGQNKRDGKS